MEGAPTLAGVFEARRRIAGLALATPLLPAESLTRRADAEVLLKLETVQPTGSFKIRGAANALLSLGDDERRRGVVTASTGNHGRAVAYAARALGIPATVCLSSLVPEPKAQAIAELGAAVRRVGRSQDEAMAEAARVVAAEGLVEVPPFDDVSVIEGQGTIGLELLEARPDLRAILVPLSGGGLAGGIALAAKSIKPALRVIGISMEAGAAMQASLAAGRPVEVTEAPTLADSLGGGIGLANRWTFALCRRLLDDVILVSESEIARGMAYFLFEERLVAEGAGAVTAAAILARKLALDGPAALIVSGRNVEPERIAAIAATSFT
ncbi:MAG TPA: hydroxyectoine utilization dehydratase EutB [Stellaceae bacterium]|nr:hydroxyectoine utilization dehydratase EutB [Stellaceae bacterium]